MRVYVMSLFSISICGLLFSAAFLAQAQELPPNWETLKLYELERATRGMEPAARSQVFAGWMAANDWRSMDLELHDLYNLYSLVNADSVDRRHFSARWSGFLTAPSTAAYTLKQARQYSGTDARLKVIIDGRTVLDSTGDRRDDSQFTSQPVQLTAGQSVPIQVDMVQDVSRIDFSEGAPMVVLTWQTDSSQEAIIPSSPFSPPAGFAEPGARGLKGEYFASMDFSDLKVTRLEPALDFVSSWPPAAPIHQQQASQVFNACKAKVLDEGFLAQAAADGKDSVFSHTLWRVAYRMRAAERKQLVEMLTRNADILSVMTPEAMGRLIEAVYMLPGDEHLELLGEWALARPQPRTQAGQFPGWGDGYYQQLNTDYYWLMGHLMQGPYWNDAETLLDDFLVRPNGECNLVIAYVAVYAAREEKRRRSGTGVRQVYARLHDRLEAQESEGDARVTWLLAQVFADEVVNSGPPQLYSAVAHLEEARLVAESSDYQFWALQESAARLASLGEIDRLNDLLGQRVGDTPQQQDAITAWRETASKVATANAERRAQQKSASNDAFMAELERRLVLAQQREDQAEIDRYQAMIDRANTKLEN